MLHIDLLMPVFISQFFAVLDGLHGILGKFIDIHIGTLSLIASICSISTITYVSESVKKFFMFLIAYLSDIFNPPGMEHSIVNLDP